MIMQKAFLEERQTMPCAYIPAQVKLLAVLHMTFHKENKITQNN